LLTREEGKLLIAKCNNGGCHLGIVDIISTALRPREKDHFHISLELLRFPLHRTSLYSPPNLPAILFSHDNQALNLANDKCFGGCDRRPKDQKGI
jgi:hypothetical protein